MCHTLTTLTDGDEDHYNRAHGTEDPYGGAGEAEDPGEPVVLKTVDQIGTGPCWIPWQN